MIYQITGPDYTVFYTDEQVAKAQLTLLNTPYRQWQVEEQQRQLLMEPLKVECARNWEQLRQFANAKKTGHVSTDMYIETRARALWQAANRPWCVEMHKDYIQPNKQPAYYTLRSYVIGKKYYIDNDDY